MIPPHARGSSEFLAGAPPFIFADERGVWRDDEVLGQRTSTSARQASDACAPMWAAAVGPTDDNGCLSTDCWWLVVSVVVHG
jgi:hypothetical protein